MFNFTLKNIPSKKALQIDLEGALISAYDARELKAKCNDALDELQNVIVNCKNLKTINSEGLNVLLHLFTLCRNRDGNFILCNVPDGISQILLFTKMQKIFTIAADLKTAKVEVA